MQTIVLSNHKGGCAKTTTAFNLSIALAAAGHKVLVVDLDQQGNLSAAFGADLGDVQQSQKNSYRLMLDETGDYSDYLIPCRKRLDLIPACLDPDAEDLLEGKRLTRELLLRSKLEAAQHSYQFCVIDTPPSLRLPTLNALAMSDLTIVPVDSSMFALLGLNQLLRTVYKVRTAHAPKMQMMALSTRFKARQILDKEIREKIIEIFTEDYVFNTTIPNAAAVEQATATLQSVIETQPEAAPAFAFRQLLKEVKDLLNNEQENQDTSRFIAK
jgi:chromosome partitioning protein